MPRSWRYPCSAARVADDYLGGVGRLSSQTGWVAVNAHAVLGKPTAPSSMSRTKTCTVRGSLTPKHASGSSAGTLMCYRRESGHWKLRKSVALTAADYLTISRYTASVKLTLRGSWRKRAKHSDSGHATTYSTWRHVTVK
jgi:hypothetical protein